MIVVGNNLKELIEQFKICPLNQFDETGINVHLDSNIKVPNLTQKNRKIIYTVTDVAPFFREKTLNKGSLILKPNEICLCCSKSEFYIPNNYFGIVQTKGSLARLFVTSNVTDSQIDPGFRGKITLEMVNYSPFTIEIPVGAKIAQIYLHKCTTNAKPYNGKYQNALNPTISKSEHL